MCFPDQIGDPNCEICQAASAGALFFENLTTDSKVPESPKRCDRHNVPQSPTNANDPSPFSLESLLGFMAPLNPEEAPVPAAVRAASAGTFLKPKPQPVKVALAVGESKPATITPAIVPRKIPTVVPATAVPPSTALTMQPIIEHDSDATMSSDSDMSVATKSVDTPIANKKTTKKRGTKRKTPDDMPTVANGKDEYGDEDGEGRVPGVHTLREQQELKKRRLARKAELARNTRRRQKTRLAFLESETIRLQTALDEALQEKETTTQALAALMSGASADTKLTVCGLLETAKRRMDEMEDCTDHQLFVMQDASLSVLERSHKLLARRVMESHRSARMAQAQQN
jgi:hypothetical protein